MKGPFRHKGLQKFFENSDKRGVQAQHVKRLRLILARLAVSSCPEDMQLPGLKLHSLSGDRRGYYAVSVTGNWRITFRFEDGAPTDIDLVDYH